jgi:DNA polymerase-3 subunit alpha
LRIPVLVPDVNRSAAEFMPVVERADDGSESWSIVFGLAAVRNVGEGLVGMIVQEREAGGPFRDFYDFCERVDPLVLNKRAIESLVKAGGFDSVGHPRRGLLAVFEQIIDRTLAGRRERDMGVFTLFGDAEMAAFDERVPIPDLEFDKSQCLAFEKEMLGLYVSDHPLMGAEALLRRRADCTVDELRDADDGAMKVCGGVVTALQRKWTKRGDLMAVFMLEDLRSAIEVMVFPKTMTEHGFKLADDAVVCVKGRVDKREDTPKLIAMEIDLVDTAVDTVQPLRLRVAPNRVSEELIATLKGLLHEHPGASPVFLHLGERQVLRLPDEFHVDQRNGLLGELRVLLGPEAILP